MRREGGGRGRKGDRYDVIAGDRGAGRGKSVAWEARGRPNPGPLAWPRRVSDGRQPGRCLSGRTGRKEEEGKATDLGNQPRLFSSSSSPSHHPLGSLVRTRMTWPCRNVRYVGLSAAWKSCSARTSSTSTSSSSTSSSSPPWWATWEDIVAGWEEEENDDDDNDDDDDDNVLNGVDRSTEDNGPPTPC